MSAARKQNPPPRVRPLIPKPPVYRRKFPLPSGEKGFGVAEFHPDKVVLHRYGGRRRIEFSFAKLWGVWHGNLI